MGAQRPVSMQRQGGPPVRLCCGQCHWGAVCPDGQVMCCVCFSRFPVAELFTDGDGDRWDICRSCGEAEEKYQSGSGGSHAR